MSDSITAAFERLKDRDADDVFNLIFVMLNEGDLREHLTPAEQFLCECVKNDAEYFGKFGWYSEEHISAVKQLGETENLVPPELQEKTTEQLRRSILFSHCDLSELLSRKSFEYGVAYGKMLATTR
jgi:hypothetical protein